MAVLPRDYFPNIVPTKRQFEAGEFPMKTFKSQSGVESKILYGQRRASMKFKLRFDNINDLQVEEILTHYDERLGSYKTFLLRPDKAQSSGWEGGSGIYKNAFYSRWRYASSPSVVQIQKGISSVTVDLVSVV